MLFNSWGYILFLLVFVPLHWLLPHRLRTGLLGATSVLFYSMWRWEFSLLVIFSACIDYLASRRIHRSDDARSRKRWLLLSLAVNLGLLVAFKYTYFIWDNIRLFGAEAGGDWPALQDLGVRIILPLGISFYTFQTISYTIDVYRRVIVPVPSFVSFLTYVTFWPQLIAGPVLRAGEVLPQLEAERRLRWGDVTTGLALIVTGMFQKVVLADSIAPMVDEIFAMPAVALTALDTWVATFLFGFQIYFDFAGYSAMAIGSAMLVGLHFPDNFDWPYMARSPRGFWQGWHISLSSWIRDYLYLPLTGQAFRTESTGGIGVATERKGGHQLRALFLTWFIMGLWHGAAWNFALWGLYHATLIALFRVLTPLKKLPDAAPMISWLLLLLTSMAGWIPFRAQGLGDSLTLFGKLLTPSAYTLGGRQADMYTYFWTAVITLGMALTWWFIKRPARRPWPSRFANPVQGLALAVMVCAILICLRTAKQFIYFQF